MSEGSGRTVGVTGATGFVGRYTVRELLGRGHRVRALVRDVEKAGKVLPTEDDRLDLVTGDLHDRAAMERLAEGAEALVNTVGIIREAPGGQTFQRIHVEGARRLVGAAASQDVKRIVQVSAIGVRDEGVCEYQRSKFEAETIIRESGLAWTILRSSLVHGPDGEFIQMVRGWVTGKATPHIFIPYFQRLESGPPIPGLAKMSDAKIAPVAVQDLAWAIGESLDQKAAEGEVYNLTGPEELTMPELIKLFQERVPLAKKGLKMIPVPDKAGAMVAKVAKLTGLQHALPYDEGMALMAGEDTTAESVKAREHLGFRPRPFRATAEAYAPNL